MKSPKVIIPIVVVVLLAGIFLMLRKVTDHSAEFREAVYAGDVGQVEELLKAHPSLANSDNMTDPRLVNGSQRIAGGGLTPLHVAACVGNVPMINLLLHYHARLEAKDKRGLTPLLWTAFAGRRDAAAALLSAGADINARGPDGRSTLDLAKLSQDANLIDLLHERGAKE